MNIRLGHVGAFFQEWGASRRPQERQFHTECSLPVAAAINNPYPIYVRGMLWVLG